MIYSKIRKVLGDFYLVFILIFLYAPIATLMILSFNASKSRNRWGGFTFDWYGELFMRKVPKTVVMAINNIPMLNADIVTGISLMLGFIAFGISLGFKTILISHITFNIPYVILSVMPKLKQTERVTYEAALDLGATPIVAFFKVVFPDIFPGVISGFLLAFTMSLDDFIITHFTKGAGINTISTLVYSEVRRGIKPSLYALSTIIFATVLILLIVSNIAQNKIKKK